MSFALFPAIDLLDGQVVRLRQGDYAQETRYSPDPSAVARAFAAAGADWIHVVDLDAARDGGERNLAVITDICAAVPQCRVQTGGGVRDAAVARARWDSGVARVVIGSAAVQRPELVHELAAAQPDRVVVGLDVRGREVSTHGWTRGAGLDVFELVTSLGEAGAAAFVVTQIDVDGLLTGPDLALYRELLEATDVAVVASGGVGSLDDLVALRDTRVGSRSLQGVIAGKAIYEARFTVEEGIRVLATRVIPCLDVDAGRVVKGVQFVDIRDAGDPVELAARYDTEGADELVFLDITASSDNRATMVHMVERVAEQVFIPFTVGGGIRSVDDVRAMLRAGADKVSLNTAAVQRPELVAEGAAEFGNQCIVVAIDARRRVADDPRQGWEVLTHGGRTTTGLDAVAWARRVCDLGAGEILLTSMDRDGTHAGYDIELLQEFERSVPVPVIASGGVGELEHLRRGIVEGGAQAVLAASIFHFGQHTIREAKEYLSAHGVLVRPPG